MKINSIVTDLDGCITAGRGKPIDLDILKRLQNVKLQHKFNIEYPWLIIITARPQPYLEAILQAIDLYSIGLFEWGAGAFFPNEYRYIFHPVLDVHSFEIVSTLKMTLYKKLYDVHAGFIQAGKEVAITIYPYSSSSLAIDNIYNIVLEVLTNDKDIFINKFNVYKGKTFVNILPKGIDKRTGLEWLLSDIGVHPANCLGIGDGEDDISFLEICGFSAAPQNAATRVKDIVDYSSPFEFGNGLLDAIGKIL